MKILVAEDNENSGKFMKEYLSKYGSCDIAKNGLEAINLISDSIENTDHYDLICLDIVMPKMNGFKTANIIRGLEKNKRMKASEKSKIVMMSTSNDDASVRKAYLNGCDSYAWKPIQELKFDEMLKKLNIFD